jgi:choline monooxygenase
MHRSLEEIIHAYAQDAPLERASTIPSAWYVDPRVMELERRTTFSRAWQVAGRVDQVREAGGFCTSELASAEPVVIVRGDDKVVRGFFNVCRHHAAAVATEAEGCAKVLRCPYHGWTYSLDGQLKGTPDFAGVDAFDRSANGLVSIETAAWHKWIFVRADRTGCTLNEFLGQDLADRIGPLDLDGLTFFARRHYTLACNWKVFVDNYLDGGYHVPHLHKRLDSVLDYGRYTIDNGERFCVQSSPLVDKTASRRTRTVRQGERAHYFWIYPNFMINWYSGAMDTNLVIPRGIDRTEVVFDFYVADVSKRARQRNLASVALSEQIQEEDVSICASVQRGLSSRAYRAGRLSVRREAGEHLFHRLLAADLKAGLADSDATT